MESLQIYISCHTQSSIIKKNWVDMFAQIFQSLLFAKTNAEIKTLTSFDQPKSEVILKSDFALMVISSDYYSSGQLSSELELMKQLGDKKDANVFRLIFTSEETGIKNDGVNALNHNFFLDDPFAHIDLSHEEGYFTEKAFWLKLVDLSHLMLPEAVHNKHFDYKIFMAEPSPDILQQWESVKRELTYMGHEVVSVNDINSKVELNQQTLEGFEKTNLIIHMIGGETGSKIDDADIVMEQISLAASYCLKTGMERRLIWLPDSLVVRDEMQRLAIEKMKRDNKALTGAEIIQTPIESFKAILQQRIHTSEDKTETVKEGKQIYVVYTPQMEKEGERLVSEIEKSEVEVIKPLKSNNKSELLKHHWQALLSCDMVALFYDADQLDWINSKRKDFIKASGFGRKEPISKKILIKNKSQNIEDLNLQDFEILDIEKMSEIEKHLRD
ncbi:MAG: hypothetical protein C0599_13840 [Salinivirgaceae bacterium]|nr:MAG: hypothetical protein C0599_13840 [Salinivirgaceae bacterium]